MFLNISRSLNYTEADAERSKELALRIEQLNLGEFPKVVVRSRELKEECWPLMEEIRKYQHFIFPVMGGDVGGYYRQLIAKKQGELKLKMDEVMQPLNDHQKKVEETRAELYSTTQPICTQVCDFLTESIKKLPELAESRQIRMEREWQDLGGDKDRDVKIVVEETNDEVIGKIRDLLIEAREKFRSMTTCSIEKIIHELEKLENRIEKLDIQKMKEQRVDKSFKDAVLGINKPRFSRELVKE